MVRLPVLLFVLLIFLGNACSRVPTYPDLRDSYDPELQADLVGTFKKERNMK